MGHVYSASETKSATHPAMEQPFQTGEVNAARSRPSAAGVKHGPGVTAKRRAHEKIKADDILWGMLLFERIEHDGDGGLLENRRCPCCGATLSRRTTALHAVGIVANLSEVHARSLDAIVTAGKAAQCVEPGECS